MWCEPIRGLVFRSLLSHVDVEGELESPTMSQGEPLPRPFLHHIASVSCREGSQWRPFWRSLTGLWILIVFPLLLAFLLKLIGSLEFASRHSGAEHVWTLPSFTRNQVKLGHGVFKRSLTTLISVLLCCQKACVYSKVSATLSAIYHRYPQTWNLQPCEGRC